MTGTILSYTVKNTNLDDVIKWKHFPRYWPFVRDSHREFPSRRPVTRNFDVFFDLHLSKRLSKRSRRRWFEPSRSLWCHCNVLMVWLRNGPGYKKLWQWPRPSAGTVLTTNFDMLFLVKRHLPSLFLIIFRSSDYAMGYIPRNNEKSRGR